MKTITISLSRTGTPVRRYIKLFCVAAVMWFAFLMLIYMWAPKYKVEYVEYRVQHGDSVFSVIERFNQHYPNKDLRDLIPYFNQANDSPDFIRVGETYKFPVIVNKVGFFEYYGIRGE
jgi:hypothetical protein